MKHRFARVMAGVVVLIGLVAAVPLDAQTAPGVWKQYSYPNDGFAISSPLQPSFTTQSKPTDAGNVEMHIYTFNLSSNGVVIITASEIKGLENLSAKDRLQKAKQGALTAGNATLTAEKEITLAGYQGLLYEATGQNNLHVRGRMYIVKNRLLQLLEISPLNVAFPADAERICTSLKPVSQ